MKIKQSGFREYDARWLYPEDVDLEGIKELGKGLGSQVISKTKKTNPKIIVGHDYRSYSEEVKAALKKGLISTGCIVEDIGLSLTPTVCPYATLPIYPPIPPLNLFVLFSHSHTHSSP